jgi:hypothetical protein
MANRHAFFFFFEDSSHAWDRDSLIMFVRTSKIARATHENSFMLHTLVYLNFQNFE